MLTEATTYPFLRSAATIGSVPIAAHVFIIAEIGINHNGSLDIAKRLISMAKSAGCDAVKFQKRTVDIVYPKDVLDQTRESPWGNTQRAQKEGLELPPVAYDEIDAYCKELGIEWLASAWDIPSQKFLRKYNLKYNKIASALATKIDFVEEVAKEGKLTFLSTGMCTYDEIAAALSMLQKHGCTVVLMHTVSTYPSPEVDLNLLCIADLQKRFNVPVGYSGHEASVSPSVMACMLGAMAVERHITLDRAMYGSDQAASLEKVGLETMVQQIRKIPMVLGDGVKRITDGEKTVAKKLRYWIA